MSQYGVPFVREKQVAAASLPRNLKPGDPLPGGGIYIDPGPEPNVRKKPPDLELIDQERQPVRLSRFRGQLVVLDIGGLTTLSGSNSCAASARAASPE